MPCGAQLEIGWIPVRKTVKKADDVHASDHVELLIRVLPILDDKRQGEILREELEKLGWEKREDGALTKRFGEAIGILPPGSTVIRLEVEAKKEITASGDAQGVVKEEDIEAQKAIEQRAEEQAQKRLDRARDAAERELTKDNIDILLRAHEAARRDADEVVKKTTKRSLEARAAQLGDIESVHEGRAEDGSYELTITVKS